MTQKFFKYHGTGNDFILIEAPHGRPSWLDEKAIRLLCHRRFGIGADGILLIEKGKEAPYFMRILNSDGSEAEMCGNGIRCVAAHLTSDETAREITIETLAGLKRCRVERKGPHNMAFVTVSLGRPEVSGDGAPKALLANALGRDFQGFKISMGNPHFVIFEWMDEASAARFGEALSRHPLFPNQANIEFVEVLEEGSLRLRVFERGCGLTMACGTGAAAAAVASVLTGKAKAGERLAAFLPGGTLYLTVLDDLSDVLLEGPAVCVFRGEFVVEELRRLETASSLEP